MDRCPDCGYEPTIREGVKPKTYGYAKLQYDLHKLVEEWEEDYEHADYGECDALERCIKQAKQLLEVE